jgi:hypothetical protein
MLITRGLIALWPVLRADGLSLTDAGEQEGFS